MNRTPDNDAVVLVARKLPMLHGRVTLHDAAAATGLSVDEARDTLARLVELYASRITLDPDGKVIFAFPIPLRERGRKSAREWIAAARHHAVRLVDLSLKILIALVIVIYFGWLILLPVALVIILLFLILGRISSNEEREQGLPPRLRTGSLSRLLALRASIITNIRLTLTLGGRAPTHYTRWEKEEKPIISAIYDFIIGPQRAARDPYADEREVAAYIHTKKGIITPAEITALSGCTIEEAEERLADYLVRFQGEPLLSEEGAVVGDFGHFISERMFAVRADIIPYWDETEPPYLLTDNPLSRNLFIILLILMMGIGGLWAVHDLGVDGSILEQPFPVYCFGYLPIILSILFLALPLIRSINLKERELERRQRGIEKQMIRLIYGGFWKGTCDQMRKELQRRRGVRVDGATVEHSLGLLLRDLGGEMILDDDGDVIYSFDRLRREVETAARYREGRVDEETHPQIQRMEDGEEGLEDGSERG